MNTLIQSQRGGRDRELTVKHTHTTNEKEDLTVCKANSCFLKRYCYCTHSSKLGVPFKIVTSYSTKFDNHGSRCRKLGKSQSHRLVRGGCWGTPFQKVRRHVRQIIICFRCACCVPSYPPPRRRRSTLLSHTLGTWPILFCAISCDCRIFEINPGASAFFKFTDGFETTDEALYKQDVFKKHATGVIATVTAAVGLLEKGDMVTLVTALKELGAKHLAYGLNLEKAHYDLVGQALLDTLATALGDEFTDETKDAWVDVYAVIAGTMMQGAAEFEE